MNETHPVVGELNLGELAKYLGTGYCNFSSGKIDGLAKVIGKELHILAVISNEPLKGHFRKFVSDCKENYGFIRFWDMENPNLIETLKRYGFTFGKDTDPFGEMQTVCDWRRA